MKIFKKVWRRFFDKRLRCHSCDSVLEYREGRIRDLASLKMKWVSHMVCPVHNWGFDIVVSDRKFTKGELITR